ncbi:creatininase family protein [Natronobiforma cellulositropha]|uniref:creatininase family protein n=1 Tax=Natronobiforma cellulositropha TaxID=1679076 RepID=UPI0021D5E659|nr:creatininase family protein [Natronobiforma cellulositropha]
MDLSAATWTDVADCESDLAVLPVGSTEQHGPHAPLGTDTLLAGVIADAAVEAFDGEVVRAPTIPVGVAAEHRHFPGTMWVSPDTFRAYVRDCVASLAAHGFERVVLVNGHGGNVGALEEVAGTISRADAAYAVAFTWFQAIGEAGAEMGHGGPLETSLLAYCHPELVREGRLEAARDGGADGWGEWVRYTSLAHDSAAFSENGVVGDPTAASAERGEALFEVAVEALVDVLETVAARDLDGPAYRG